MRDIRLKTLLAVIAAMLLSLIGYGAWSLLASGSALPDSIGDDVSTTSVGLGTAKQADATRTAIPPDASPARAATAGSLRLELSYDDGSPSANLTVICAPAHADVLIPSAKRLIARSDAAGIVRHRNLEPGRYRFDFPHPRMPGVEAIVRPGEEAIVKVRFRPGFSIHGEVVDRSDRPIAHAAIWSNKKTIAHSDAQGRFTLQAVRVVKAIGASAAGYAPSPIQVLTGDPGSKRQVRLVLQGNGGAVQGLVLDADGERVPHAQIIFLNRDLPWTYLGKSQSWSLAPVIAITDDEGRFLCEGLPPLALPFEVRAAGKGMVKDTVSVTADGTSDVVIRLPVTATLHGHVLSPEGEPIADAKIGGSETGGLYQTTYSRADGSYRLEGLNPGKARIVVFAGKDRMDTDFDLAAGENLERDLQFKLQPRIRGRLLTKSGDALVGWRIKASGKQRIDARAATDSEGYFELKDLDSSQAYRLKFYKSMPHMYANHVQDDIYTGAETQLITIPETALIEGSIRGRLLDWRGQPLTTAKVTADRSGDFLSIPQSVDPNAEFRFADLPPGHYSIKVKNGPLWIDSAEVDLAPGQNLDLGDLRQARLGTISIDITGDGAKEAKTARFFDSSRVLLGTAELDWNTLERYPISPGDYYIQVLGETSKSKSTAFTVRAGENVRVAIDLP